MRGCSAFFAAMAVSAGASFAACAAIEAPAPNDGLERMKSSLEAGQLTRALATSELTREAINGLVGQLEPYLTEGAKNCMTLHRSRAGAHWINEVVLFETEELILYFMISGEVRSNAFRLINLSFTSEFDDVRGLIY